MLESGVRIGAVSNRDAVGDRTRLYRAKVLTPQEAQELGYQTLWSAIIPDPDVPPRKPTIAELKALTTPRAKSRINPVYFSVAPAAMATLEGMRSGFSDTSPRLEYGPLIELAPGIEARLSIVRQDPDRPTTARNRMLDNPNLSIDPHFPPGASVAIHNDQEGVPVGTLATAPLRGIVVMNSDSGPSTHTSLFVKRSNVFDLASVVAPGDMGYVPMSSDMIPLLVKQVEGKEEIVGVELGPGEAGVLAAWGTFHDGMPNRQQRAYTAVTFEPTEPWSEEALIANSLFK